MQGVCGGGSSGFGVQSSGFKVQGLNRILLRKLQNSSSAPFDSAQGAILSPFVERWSLSGVEMSRDKRGVLQLPLLSLIFLCNHTTCNSIFTLPHTKNDFFTLPY